jgi:hypothetical protein
MPLKPQWNQDESLSRDRLSPTRDVAKDRAGTEGDFFRLNLDKLLSNFRRDMLHAGFDVQVYEQSRVLREVGADINVTPNAARVIHKLGFRQYQPHRADVLNMVAEHRGGPRLCCRIVAVGNILPENHHQCTAYRPKFAHSGLI